MFSSRVNLSVAVVAMTSNRTHTYPNGTVETVSNFITCSVCCRLTLQIIQFQYPDFEWDSGTQGLILASFFYGYIITQIPGGYKVWWKEVNRVPDIPDYSAGSPS